jgi:hypothetical protein
MLAYGEHRQHLRLIWWNVEVARQCWLAIDVLSGGAVRQKADQIDLPKNQTNVAIHPTVRITPTTIMTAGHMSKIRLKIGGTGIFAIAIPIAKCI